jgi:hypothetical protein
LPEAAGTKARFPLGESQRPDCDPRHCRLNRIVVDLPSTRGESAAMGKEFEMFDRRRPHELRLGIRLEAEALMSGMGADAYWAARRRAQEASSDAIARDWSSVALAIARKTKKHAASPLATQLH